MHASNNGLCLYFKGNHDNVKNRDKNQHKLQGEKIMKYMFASDVHGSAYYCRKMLEAYDKKRRRRDWCFWEICFITDQEMTFRRNTHQRKVIRLLNDRKNQIYAVRGNCEAEVDQMVLDFPVMADYCILPSMEKLCTPHTVISIIKIIFRR